jgi:hypothetical protein
LKQRLSTILLWVFSLCPWQFYSLKQRLSTILLWVFSLCPCQFYSCLSGTTSTTVVLRNVNVIQAYQNNDIESLLPCSLDSCLSYRTDIWNSLYIHPAVKEWASRSTTTRNTTSSSWSWVHLPFPGLHMLCPAICEMT